MTRDHDQDVEETVDVDSEGPVEIHPAMVRFVAAIDKQVDGYLTEEALEDRLRQVRRRAEQHALADREWSLEDPTWRDLAERLAGFGYFVVGSWLQVILVWTNSAAAAGAPAHDLTRTDVEELTHEVVARALNTFRHDVRESGHWPDDAAEETDDTRQLFVTLCLQQLPKAYLSRMLETGRLPDRMEEIGNPAPNLLILPALHHSLTNRRQRTVNLMNSWSFTQKQCDEIVGLTLRAFEDIGGRPPNGAGATGAQADPNLSTR
jgi:hypothetical protein